MRLRSTAILAVSLAATAVLPANPASARLSRVAYFKVAFVATQATTWSEDITAHSCGGVQRTTGHGGSSLRVRTPAAQPAVARQVHGGGREELLTFRGGTGSLPA